MQIDKYGPQIEVPLDEMIQIISNFKERARRTEANETSLEQINTMITYLKIEHDNPQLINGRDSSAPAREILQSRVQEHQHEEIEEQSDE